MVLVIGVLFPIRSITSGALASAAAIVQGGPPLCCHGYRVCEDEDDGLGLFIGEAEAVLPLRRTMP